MGLDSDPSELVALGMLGKISDGANDTAPIVLSTMPVSFSENETKNKKLAVIAK